MQYFFSTSKFSPQVLSVTLIVIYDVEFFHWYNMVKAVHHKQ
nr:MAG TPA: hypothetical protein [Caudoviricetes sp.]DAH53258.1 MAG TPA: hypothetical protein [Caudoviricetes sp.]